jgi:hypothetical protein
MGYTHSLPFFAERWLVLVIVSMVVMHATQLLRIYYELNSERELFSTCASWMILGSLHSAISLLSRCISKPVCRNSAVPHFCDSSLKRQVVLVLPADGEKVWTSANSSESLLQSIYLH